MNQLMDTREEEIFCPHLCAAIEFTGKLLANFEKLKGRIQCGPL
jgi:hypothetical protein